MPLSAQAIYLKNLFFFNLLDMFIHIKYLQRNAGLQFTILHRKIQMVKIFQVHFYGHTRSYFKALFVVCTASTNMFSIIEYLDLGE
jgi:hypothetical protein